MQNIKNNDANKFFPEAKRNFAFGCMRLPMNGDQVDFDEFSKMVDYFLDNGFNYFDTAHGYLRGKSETALRECLVKRHKREEYVLVNKLSENYFKTEDDLLPMFEGQLEACGVDYFDFYLLHAQASTNYEQYQRCKAYDFAFEMKKAGKVRHVGLSFHDKADVLEKILNDHPDVEVVQLQFNYLDYYDPQVESKKCYDVCVKYGKPVLVMEPVRGGSLVNLPEKAKAELEALNNGSIASYAIRFAASFDNIAMVLSGMSNMEQMMDNVSYMKDFKPLNDKEMAAINNVRDIITSENLIPCTACEYCVAGCPKNILIPNLFADYNNKKREDSWLSSYYYDVHTQNNGKASDCIQCGKCEKICPQHLPIREHLKQVAETFDKK